MILKESLDEFFLTEFEAFDSCLVKSLHSSVLEFDALELVAPDLGAQDSGALGALKFLALFRFGVLDLIGLLQEGVGVVVEFFGGFEIFEIVFGLFGVLNRRLF